MRITGFPKAGIRLELVFVMLLSALTAACSSAGSGGTVSQPATVSVSILGNGTVSSSDGAIACAPVCIAQVAPGSQITFTAAPASGAQFLGWGGACASAGSATSCTITVPASGASVTAEFGGAQTLGDSFALLDGSVLVSFNRSAPEVVTSTVQLTGMASGELLVGMDFRPADGKLYGIGSLGNLYLLPHTATTPSAAVTHVATLSANPVVPGVRYGVDADPVLDVLRIVGSDGSNAAVAFSDGRVTALAPLTPRAISAVAHSHAFAGATGTVLFGLDLSGDASSDRLVVIDEPAGGSARDGGTLRVDANAAAGFEITGTNLDAWALLGSGQIVRLYRVNLGNGVASLVGSLARQGTVTGLAMPPEAVSGDRGDMLAVLAGNSAAGGGSAQLVPFNQLAGFDRADPGTILQRLMVVGLAPGEKVADADYRPVDRVLYALSDQGRLYTIDEDTGLATLHATLSDDGSGSFNGLGSSNLGIAFNPVSGMLHVVTAARQNLLVDPDSGLVTVQGQIAYDGNQGSPSPTAIAYTDSFAGVRSSRALVIDNADDNVAVLDGNSLGARNGGPMGVDAGAVNGLRIDPVDGVAWAALTVDGATRLYRIAQTAAGFGGAGSPALIGDGALPAVALAIRPPLNAQVFAVTTDNRLVSFLASDPAMLLSDVAISGLSAGAQIVAIDFRPSDRLLIGVGSDNRIYAIDRATGSATQLSEMMPSPDDPSDPFASLTSVDGVGAGFDPSLPTTAAALRVVSENDQNLRVNVGTGETFTDPLSYPAPANPLLPGACESSSGTVVAGAVAYSQDRVRTTAAPAIYVIANNGANTCLYTLDRSSGQLTAVGQTQAASSAAIGMAIAGGQNGLVLGAFDTGAANSMLYTIDLASGAASDAAAVQANARLRSIAIVLDPAP